MKSPLLTVLAPAFACLASIAMGQWPHQVGANLLVTDLSTAASGPSVAADGAGGVFAAWDEARTSVATGQDVFVQYYNTNGVAQWTANGVPVSIATGRQDAPLVVNAGGGSVYVVWPDERDTPSSGRIYAQLFNAAGAPQWTLNGIRVGPNDFAQTQIAACADGSGNLLVAWAETSNNFRTFVQKIDATGALLWSAGGFEFSSGVFPGASKLNVIPDGAGGAVLGWIQFGVNPRTVWMRRILANGTAAFNAVGFANDVQALTNFIPMAPDGTGGAFLGWQVDNGANDNLYIQRVDGSGNVVWVTGSKQIVDQPGVQDNLQLVSDGVGGAYLTWDDPRTGTDNVYVQHVNAAGTLGFATDGLPVGTTTGQRFTSQAIPDGAGGAIVSFRYNQTGAFAQRIDIAGTRLWGADGAQLTDNATVNFPVLTSDGFNGAIYGALTFTNGNRPALKRLLASGLLPTSRLVNISTRAFVGTGDAQAIPGFVIGGAGNKDLLIRAVGPTLGPLGVNGPLADPFLTLFDNLNAPMVTRDDWGSGSDAALIQTTATNVGAFALPLNSKDAAIVVTLPPQKYTAGVTGVGGANGVALVEIYDADALSSPAQLINLSSRVFVGTGEQLAIPGFVIIGPATMRLLIRAIGPTLSTFNVPNSLADPILTLYDGANNPITTNDDWGAGGLTQRDAIIAAASQVFAFALNNTSKDSTLLITLAPGKYTAGVVGVAGGTGVCLIELYVVP